MAFYPKISSVDGAYESLLLENECIFSSAGNQRGGNAQILLASKLVKKLNFIHCKLVRVQEGCNFPSSTISSTGASAHKNQVVKLLLPNVLFLLQSIEHKELILQLVMNVLLIFSQPITSC